MPTYAKSLTIEQYQALLNALPVHCASTVVTIGGVNYTVSALSALIQEVLDAEAAVPKAKAVWLEAIAAAAKLEATKGRTIKVARGILAHMFENSSATLAYLGIESPKPRAQLSSEARILATEKLRATRIARGTKSKKQKAKIKGNVTGVDIQLVTKDVEGVPPNEEG